MIIRSVGGLTPAIDPSARLADTACVIGDVSLERDVSVWYGAVLRGDAGPIRVGEGTNLQDNCVLHCAAGVPVAVGRGVVVGHGAVLHSCTVEDGCLIGMSATLLDGCVIGAGSLVGAGAVVPPGMAVPPGSVVLGVPGRVVRAASESEMAAIRENAAWYVRLAGEQLISPGEG